MRFWLLSGLALLSLGGFRGADASGISDATALLPDCALQCLVTSIVESQCSLTDQPCICEDEVLLKEVTICVKATCTVKESLTTKNATQTICQAPVRDSSRPLYVLVATFGTITGVVVLFRLVYRLWMRLGWEMDDWFTLILILLGVPQTIIIAHGIIPVGLGKDVWTLPFDTITKFGYFFYIMEVCYFAEIALLKTIFLFLYLHIFVGVTTRRVLWATLILNGLFGVAFILAGIFQCRPISYFWTKWDGEHEGSCVNNNALAWANAIISIMFDVWILAIPISQLRKMQMHWKRKVAVGIMFAVGAFVTIVSVLRLQSIVHFTMDQDNPTWENAAITKWSAIEVNVGLICACMPTIRMALVKAFKIFREGTTNRGYVSGKDNYPGSRSRSIPHQGSSSHRGNAARVDSIVDERATDAYHSSIACTKSYTVEYGIRDDDSDTPMREFDTIRREWVSDRREEDV
ncbi:related to integral membrane protein PTH11 [Cephalotrichum gorgonifer]|uniref:Related to integral membrane protein PTH11 n=1 Tax=Cephalotrichum gorgonifer TaxID=2041049 RepID=A0AAE8MZL1_9PEZI|nr:related to integral membrane protein PTH11 [Cephalotrichum gorgonifer]